jgi:dihydroflavonol-4-reductase
MTNDSCHWNGRQVLITGATGFVGHHVAMQLLGAGARVRVLARDPSKSNRLEAAGAEVAAGDVTCPGSLAAACTGCEYVFHLAGVVHFGDDWDLFRRVNVQGTQNTLDAARVAGVRRFVHTSSIVAVGAAARPRVLDERSVFDLDRLAVPYVTTKHAGERIALGAAAAGQDVVVVNPASVIGPDDFTRSEFGTLCRRFWRGRIPFYFGGGNCFVDVRDVAAGHLRAAERGRSGQRYVLGGANLTYGDFFRELAAAAGRPIFRLRLPNLLRSGAAWLNGRLARRTGRAYLTSGQARLLALYFYYDWAKARGDLGYEPRALADTLADSYQFWCGDRAA